MRVLYVSLLLVTLGGCVSLTPGDLSFKSAHAVDWRTQTEMPGPDASPLRGILSDDQLAMAGEPITGGPKQPRLLLKVEFSSAADIPAFMSEKSIPMWSFAYRCDDSDKENMAASLTVYWRGIRLTPQAVSSILPRAAPFTYYIYLDAVRKPDSRAIPPRKGYDFRRQAFDVCFGVEGRSGVLARYKSNIAILPKASIEAAMVDRPDGF